MTDKPVDIDPTLPEVVKDFLRKGATLEEIRLSGGGQWTHEGLVFSNSRLIDLFSRSVGRTEGGTWVLEIGPFTYPITVEDTGFFVERVDWSHSPPLLTVSNGTTEQLDPGTLSYESGGRLYCRIDDGKFRARFKRNAYHSIMDHLREDDGDILLVIDDREVLLANLDQLEEVSS